MSDPTRQELLELRDYLWERGLIRLGGLVRMDKALGLETYRDEGGIRRASE